MIRPLCIALLSCTALIATPAFANVGPKIAYSTQTEVYLINPDGTGKVQLLKTKSNNFVSSVSLRPGGGQIAFVEAWVVKFMDFDVAGRPVGTVRSIASACFRLSDVRYHPDGNSVLYHEHCGDRSEIKQSAIPTAANPRPTPTVLFSEDSKYEGLFESSWDPSGTSIIYSAYTADQHELRRLTLGGSTEVLFSRSGEQIRYPDVSPDGKKILFSNYALSSTLGVGYTDELDTTSESVQRRFKGQYARYEPAGSRILYIDYQTYNARYLKYVDSDGQHRQIGGKAVYWSVDWRK